MKQDVVVLVPIYKPKLDAEEQFSLDQSVNVLAGRDIRFIMPEKIDSDYYINRYPQIAIEKFEAPCFESIVEYNRLLLKEDFYKRYLDFEFTLILQTDAIILRDDLNFWFEQPFDYVGAPWPVPYKIFINLGLFEGSFGKNVHTGVGNGGLSLRRNKKIIQLLREFPIALDVFNKTGSSEDLFFSVMGTLSTDFIIPNEITASLFSMEGHPSHYFRINGGRFPMGGHAWLINEPEFWKKAFISAGVSYGWPP